MLIFFDGLYSNFELIGKEKIENGYCMTSILYCFSKII